MTDIPEQLLKYDCRDYLTSELATDGCWSEDEQLWLVVPMTEVEEKSDSNGRPLNFLAVGRPGVDGIAVGYRLGRPGFWAYFPIEGEFLLIAPTVQEFLKSWRAGEITI